MVEHPFDAAAPDYDRDFTELQPGRWYRETVWEVVSRRFESADRVLDLGCGTGEDAVFLARLGPRVRAVDVSAGMLAKAREKAEALGLEDRISFEHGDLADLVEGEEELYDGALSNFGPLNCLEDLRPFAETLAVRLRPGAPILLVVMGPLCPWEILWYLLHLRVGKAFRRFRRGLDVPVGSGGPTVKVWYHSPRTLRKALTPYFHVRRTIGIGSVLPPPYLSGLVGRAPRLFRAIAPLDRRLGRFFPFNWMNDHYLMVAERKG